MGYAAGRRGDGWGDSRQAVGPSAASEKTRESRRICAKKQRRPVHKSKLTPIHTEIAFGRIRRISYKCLILIGLFGGPGRDRTDDLFHAMEEERQPEICFQVVSNWYIGRKPVYWTIFPAKIPCVRKQTSCMGGGFCSSGFRLIVTPPFSLHWSGSEQIAVEQ